jgi:hypothetical protein
MLADLHTARQALALVVQLAERLRRVVVSPDVQAGVGAVLETAVRALARTRPWV